VIWRAEASMPDFMISRVLALWSLGSLLFFFSDAEVGAGNIECGLSTVNITPPGIGWRRYGYYQEIFITGVHDPLFAKAFVMEQGEEKAALLECDLCFITRRLSDTVRERASILTGIPKRNIIICATHTHSGPDYDGVLRDIRHETALRETQRDEHEPVDYFAMLADRCVEAIFKANQARKPVQLQVGDLMTENIAYQLCYYTPDGTVQTLPPVFNAWAPVEWKSKSFWLILMVPIGGLLVIYFCLKRRVPRPAVALVVAGLVGIEVFLAFLHGSGFPDYRVQLKSQLTGGNSKIAVRPAGPVDPELSFLLISETGQHPLGSLSAFACHPIGFLPNQFSGDYPAYLDGALRDHFGDGFISIFGIGAAGDIGNIDCTGEHRPSKTNEPARIGYALSGLILTNLSRLEAIETPNLAVRTSIVDVPLEEITPEDVAFSYKVIQQNDEQAPVSARAIDHAWKVLNVERFRKSYGASIPMEVNAVRIGNDTAIVTLPHEVFVELGLAIKKASPFKHTFVITLANDLDVYVPTRRAFAEGAVGSYEVNVSAIKPGGGEILADAAIKLLQELKP
jgi:hypothetical protein